MNGTAVLTSFNVSDTNQTVVIDMEPSRNVSLQLLLGAGAPPNHTRYNHSSTILEPRGAIANTHTHLWQHQILSPLPLNEIPEEVWVC